MHTKLDNALRKLERLPRVLNRIGDLLVTEVQRNLSGRVLHKRTGNLYNCMHFVLSAQQLGWKLTVGSSGDVAYDWIHEFGGWSGKDHKTYTPKRSYLRKAYLDKKATVRRLLHDYIHRIFQPG